MATPHRITICRLEHFNAAHRLYNPAWSDEENTRVFGKCANPNFHGHNYELIVKVTGPVIPERGYVMDLKHLSDLIKEQIVERYDHRNLNVDVEDFAGTMPSAEMMAVRIWERLRNHLEPHLDLKVVLYETPRNFVEYDGQ